MFDCFVAMFKLFLCRHVVSFTNFHQTKRSSPVFWFPSHLHSSSCSCCSVKAFGGALIIVLDSRTTLFVSSLKCLLDCLTVSENPSVRTFFDVGITSSCVRPFYVTTWNRRGHPLNAATGQVCGGVKVSGIWISLSNSPFNLPPVYLFYFFLWMTATNTNAFKQCAVIPICTMYCFSILCVTAGLSPPSNVPEWSIKTFPF